LHQHVQANNVGVVYAAETGFQLASNPDTVRAPDVAFVRQDRATAVEEETGYFPGAPDLVAEVISPHDLYTEVEEKVIAWLEAGTQMVLVVNPRKRIVTVYRSLKDISVLTENDYLDGADVVPGWTLPVRDIFASGSSYPDTRW
jgi:Uma2 family endonuclease